MNFLQKLIGRFSSKKVSFYGKIREDKNGYSWINEVRRNGKVLDVGDVFCPGSFSAGSWVKFKDLKIDRKRPGKFRCHNSQPVQFDFRDRASRVLYLKLVSSSYDPIIAKNDPFSELLEDKFDSEMISRGDYIRRAGFDERMKKYLNLPEFIDFTINYIENIALVKEYVELCNRERLAAQVEMLEKAHVALSAFFSAKANPAPFIVPYKYFTELFCMGRNWYTFSKNGKSPNDIERSFANCCESWFKKVYDELVRFDWLDNYRARLMSPELLKKIARAKQEFDTVALVVGDNDDNHMLLGVKEELACFFVLHLDSGDVISEHIGKTRNLFMSVNWQVNAGIAMEYLKKGTLFKE